MNKNHHLFLFTIGPVQGFIAQARKTRDLYAGSQILSALVADGMRAFGEEFPTGKVIFPDPDNTDGASLPNRFIGKVTADASELKAKAQRIQLAVEDTWMKIAKKSLKDAGVDPKSPRSEAQLKALLDIHWVFNEIKTDYAEAYEGLERLGGAVKNIRRFEQLEEAGRKCSIDGTNNALFYQAGQKDSKPSSFMDIMGKPEPIKGFALSKGEGLSAVSLTKRFYPLEGEKFPTIAEVALMYDEKNLSSDNQIRLKCFKNLFVKEKVVESCLDMFNNGLLEKAKMVNPGGTDDWNDDPFDYQMLYEKSLNESNLPNADQRALLQHLHKALKASLKTRYYAVILFDGDHMGKWLSGENNKSTSNLEEFHTKLSGALAKFGQAAKDYLDKSEGNGHAVYAGGDDFLGFVNIHCLFEVMEHLRKRFDEIVNTAIAEFRQPDRYLTFSAGIVIAHYKAPFSELLKKARDAEKAAKKEGGRNAFSIAVMKHSGEIQEAIYKWDKDELSSSGCSNWEALEQIYKALDKDNGDFSNTFIQNLTTEITGLTGVDMASLPPDRGDRSLQNIMPVEIGRLVARAWKEGQKKDKEKINELSKGVEQLWNETPKESGHRPRHFIHALHVADFLTRKIIQEQ